MTQHMTFSEIVQDFLADRKISGKAKTTLKYYKWEFNTFTNWLIENHLENQPIIHFTPAQLRDFFAWLSLSRPGCKGRGKGGRHASYRAIKALFRFIWDQEDIQIRNPISKVKIEPNRIPPLAEMPLENIQAVLNHINPTNCRYPLRDRAIVFMLLDTGLRASELCDLRYGDINMVTGQVNVMHGKGDKFRIGWIGESTLKVLNEYLLTRVDIKLEEPLFENQEHQKLTYAALRNLLSKLTKISGVPYQGVHSLRRAYAKLLWKAGLDILAVSHLLGHSSPTVTTRYLNINNEEYHEIHNANSPADLLK